MIYVPEIVLVMIHVPDIVLVMVHVLVLDTVLVMIYVSNIVLVTDAPNTEGWIYLIIVNNTYIYIYM